MKIVAFSDVHTQWKNLSIPKCDILISAGDYSFRGEKETVFKFHKWLSQQPAKHIISVQGNHELWVEQNFSLSKSLVPSNIHFIDVGLLEIEGIKIFCSSVTPFYCNWAWNRYKNELERHWNNIPKDTDVLITHGPPFNMLDQDKYGKHLGCKELSKVIPSLSKLKLHVFGHIHNSSGTVIKNNTTFVNASICNDDYKVVNSIKEIIV